MKQPEPKPRDSKLRQPVLQPIKVVAAGVLLKVTLCAAQGSWGSAAPVVPELTELIWALVFIGGFVVAAIIWMAVLRRSSNRQLQSIRAREAALHEHYQDLFENAHDILFAHGMDGQITALNHAGEQILGYPRAEACRLKFTQLVVPEDRTAYFHVLERLQNLSDRGHVELTVAARSGESVVLRINVRRQSLPGRSVQILGVAWDITQRRRAEEALRQSELQLRHSLEERIRIGRDLHDGIIQSIYAVGLGLSECRRLLVNNPTAEARLGKSVEELNSIIRDVRNFIGGLEPEALKGRDFGHALKSVARSLSDGAAVDFVFEIDPQAAASLSARQAAHLLQIAREAMTNALRHGAASRVHTKLFLADRQLKMQVQDDGTGFDVTRASGPGLGLKNLQSRVHELGGTVDVDSDPGRGTRVTLELPVAPSDDQ